MTLLMTLGGALLLMVAGDALVRGAIGLSLKFGLSAALISLTVVAFGTSAPELVISIEAALAGSPDIALGNVVGSNIANVLLIVGVPATIITMAVSSAELRRSFTLMMIATVIFVAFAVTGEFNRIAGVIMLTTLAAIMIYSYGKSGNNEVDLDDADEAMSGLKIGLLMLAGIIGLPIGAHFLIEGARAIALSIGLSEAAIGLTIVALGTSLPELAASTAAALRGRGDVALGNVIGSNMLNLLAVIGVTAIIHPLTVSRAFQTVDIPIMAATSILLAPFLIWRMNLGRAAGVTFLVLYATFVVLALGDASI